MALVVMMVALLDIWGLNTMPLVSGKVIEVMKLLYSV
jgi:hypothetical protein